MIFEYSFKTVAYFIGIMKNYDVSTAEISNHFRIEFAATKSYV